MPNLTAMSAYPRWWLWGLPAPIWMERAKYLEEFVKANRLKPVTYTDLWVTKPLPPRFKPRPPLPGIVPFAHIHVGEKLYALNDDQWARFSADVMSDIKTRLEGAKTVEFEALMEISQGMAAAGL